MGRPQALELRELEVSECHAQAAAQEMVTQQARDEACASLMAQRQQLDAAHEADRALLLREVRVVCTKPALLLQGGVCVCVCVVCFPDAPECAVARALLTPGNVAGARVVIVNAVLQQRRCTERAVLTLRCSVVGRGLHVSCHSFRSAAR